MSSTAGKRTTIAALAIAAALLLPASQAAGSGAKIASAGSGPIATKSGAIVNYTSTGAIKLRNRLGPNFVCAVTCNLTSSLTLKGLGGKVNDVKSATDVPAGQVLQHYFKFKTFPKAVRNLIRDRIGKFHLVSNVTATDVVSGVSETISHTFKLKR